MNRKRTISFLVFGALALAVGFGTVAYRTVLAAAPQAGTLTQTNYGLGNGPGFGGYTDANLAQALGITTTQLDTAYQKANSNALSEAVSKGLITQAQADQINANGSAFPLGRDWISYLSQNGIDYNSLLASALGISVDNLQAAYIKAYDAGIDQAVSNGQLTQQQADLMKGQYALYNNSTFQSAMQSAFKAAVQQAVTSGVITQAQADQILSSQNNTGIRGLGGFGEPGGFFSGGRHGGFGGDFRGGPLNNQNNQTSPSTPATPSAPSTTPSSNTGA